MISKALSKDLIMNATFSDRLRELMEHYRLNKNSMSVKLGFTANTSITRLANHPERNPSYELLVTILKAFPGLSGRWLILGEGKMFVKDEIDSQTIWTKYYGKDLLGVIQQVTDIPPIGLIRIHGYPDCELAVDVYGDNMAPKFLPGDIVLCKKVNIDDSIAFGEAYLICLNEPIVRYIKSSPTPETFKVSAENPRFEDMIIQRSDVNCLYRIKGLIRREAV
jgi:hypothetical protein